MPTEERVEALWKVATKGAITMEMSLVERQRKSALCAMQAKTSFGPIEAEQKLNAVCAILYSDTPEERLEQFLREAV